MGGVSIQYAGEPRGEISDRRLGCWLPHNPANLEGIEAIEQILGTEVPQVAVFDTAFHTQIPLPAAITLVLMSGLNKTTSAATAFTASVISTPTRSTNSESRTKELRLITCHLGNGCSLAAIRDGHSVDTTMGSRPRGMMGSRSGSADPGILIYLMRQKGYTADQLDRVLNHASGLKGISGVSADMRQIVAIAQDNSRAALNMYVHRLRSCIGGYASSGGLDTWFLPQSRRKFCARSAACEAFGFRSKT